MHTKYAKRWGRACDVSSPPHRPLSSLFPVENILHRGPHFSCQEAERESAAPKRDERSTRPRGRVVVVFERGSFRFLAIPSPLVLFKQKKPAGAAEWQR